MHVSRESCRILEHCSVNSGLQICVWRNAFSTVSFSVFPTFFFYFSASHPKNRIFERAPATLSFFRFKEEHCSSGGDDSFFRIPSVAQHVKDVVNKLEGAVKMMMENELEFLGETLRELGWRHGCYGVNPSHYLLLEAAFLRTLEITLADRWTRQIRGDWTAVVNFITLAMMSGEVSGKSKPLSIIRKERKLGDLSVATLTLTVMKGSTDHVKSTSALSRSCSSLGEDRFTTTLTPSERRLSDPPKPASRSMFYGFFNDTLPSMPRRNSEANLPRYTEFNQACTKSLTDLPSVETDAHSPSKQVANKQSKLTKRSIDPASLLLRNDVFGSIGSPLRKLGPIDERQPRLADDDLPKVPSRRISPIELISDSILELNSRMKEKKRPGLPPCIDHLPKQPCRKISCPRSKSCTSANEQARKACEEAIVIIHGHCNTKQRSQVAMLGLGLQPVSDASPLLPRRKRSVDGKRPRSL